MVKTASVLIEYNHLQMDSEFRMTSDDSIDQREKLKAQEQQPENDTQADNSDAEEEQQPVKADTSSIDESSASKILPTEPQTQELPDVDDKTSTEKQPARPEAELETPAQGLKTLIAEENDGYSEAEIEKQLTESTVSAQDYQQKQAVMTTAIDGISIDDLTLEDMVEEQEVKKCLNCSAPLKGSYCHECGQKEGHFIRFFPKILWEMLYATFDLDSRILRTLIPLLISPGRLSMEYFAGKRATYVNPLRLYIILSLLFFIFISLFSNAGEKIVVKEGTGEHLQIKNEIKNAVGESDININEPQMQSTPTNDTGVNLDGDIQLSEDDTSSGLALFDKNPIMYQGKAWDIDKNPFTFDNTFTEETTRELNQFLWAMQLKLKKAIKEDPSELIDEFYNVIPQLMFILLPLFALLLKFTYIFKKRYYMEHLIVALHSHCFMFFTLIIIMLCDTVVDMNAGPDWLRELLGYLSVILVIWIPINIFITQKKVYGQGYLLTSIKFIFIGMSYSALLLLTAASAFVVGLASL